MNSRQLSLTKKIAEQTKKDIEDLRKAYDFVNTEKFQNLKGGKSIAGTSSLYLKLWCYFSFTDEQYIDFLKRYGSEVDSLQIPSGNFNHRIENPTFQHVELIDRLNYSVKFLVKNFDIPPPHSMKSRENENSISIGNGGWDSFKEIIIKQLEVFIPRILMLIENIEKFNIDNTGNTIDQYKNEWIEKLTKNKHAELLSEMRQFYQINKDNDKVFKLILLKQRLTKLKEESQLGTRTNDEMDMELNKITKAILEIIE